jgi:hypothetical protein
MRLPIHRRRPNDFPSTRLFAKCGNHQLFVAIPEQDLADAAEFAKLLKDHPHRILYLAVRNDFHAIIFGANVADRNQSQNLTTANLVQSLRILRFTIADHGLAAGLRSARLSECCQTRGRI